MTTFLFAIKENNQGYAAIFACIGIGFLFLRRACRGETGPGFWAASFFLNSLGFFFWAGIVFVVPWHNYLAGELLHVAGFFALAYGAYRFLGYGFKAWNAVALASWIALWLGSFMIARTSIPLAGFMLKALRAVIFIASGAMILWQKSERAFAGRQVAGWSLMAWGAYTLVFAFVRVEALVNLAYGLLVGFQVLAAFGLTSMVMDKERRRAEASEERAMKLEGLLPTCSYCKKIRDDKGQWHSIESYIEERSEAEFSHGICPDCMARHYPELKSRAP